MALHNTQCPHCFTTYVISDEQLRVSEGAVRCGTCRERFQARIIKEDAEATRFDPREAFIEPLTDQLDSSSQAADNADSEPQDYSFANLHTESEKGSIGDNFYTEMSIDIDQNAPVSKAEIDQLSAAEMLAKLNANRSVAEKREQARKAIKERRLGNTATGAINPKTGQHELPLPRDERRSANPKGRIKPPVRRNSSATETRNKEALIDQVDSLVDNKLANTSENKAAAHKVKQTNAGKSNRPFQLDRKPKVRSYSWLLAVPLLIIIVALTITLVYQLWMKQIVVFKNNSFAQENIAKLSMPITKKLAEYEVFLPVRRNLSKLELASAHTEAHPTRSSTTLLRISIINHAEIEQPLPWIEVSLTDSDGHLVSRRKLSPNDYVYQNATNTLIGARELKKVTIELLSFPKQATGYEVKMLSK